MNDLRLAEIRDKIDSWIISNSSMRDNHHVWKVGVASLNSIGDIQHQIMNDMECVHWKYWTVDSFHEAIKLTGQLHKSPEVFKSELCNYRSFGKCIFIYKTRMVHHDLFHLTRGFYGKLSVAS